MLLLGLDIASVPTAETEAAGVDGLPSGIEGTPEAWKRMRAVLGEEE